MEENKFGKLFENLLKEVGDPVEFQLPDWLKRQKPMSYTVIRRNIYLTKKIRKHVEDDGIFCSCNPSMGSTVCGRDCLCGMLLSSCSPSCRCGSSCLNKPFHQRPIKKMKLVKICVKIGKFCANSNTLMTRNAKKQPTRCEAYKPPHKRTDILLRDLHTWVQYAYLEVKYLSFCGVAYTPLILWAAS